ncbi:MAG: hypothetical protein KY439_03520 [Actinobacteria bacterium]|nr:hypothetical protein [Actinomycetota bacterium]
MRDVYACRLPLVEDGARAFERALELVRGEVARGASLTRASIEAADGLAAPEAGVELRWRLLSVPDEQDRLWTLRWQRPHPDDSDLVWHLHVDVALEAGAAWVGVRLALRPLGHRVVPLQFDIRPPGLVGAVVDGVEVAEDGWALAREPAYAEDDDGVRALAQLLLDPDRVLPVVIITPAERYDDQHDVYRDEPLVNADAVAESLVGLAHVVVIDTTALTYRLTDYVGRELSVFGGALRLYWPEVAAGDLPPVHPLWLPDRLAESRNQPIEKVLLRRVASTATYRVSAAALDARLRRAVERHGRAEITELFNRAKDASLAPEWQEELERAWARIEGLEAENAELARQLAIAHDNLSAMSRHMPIAVAEEEAEDVGSEAGAPGTVAEAVEWAKAECDNLIFLEDAVDSARRAAYRHPARVYKALLVMDTVAGRWSRGQLPAGFRHAFAEHGLDFAANVSPTALGKYAHEYQRTYEGRTINMGPHLGLGRGTAGGCRIYFQLDEDKHLFVVGHVGNHLSDSTTG